MKKFKDSINESKPKFKVGDEVKYKNEKNPEGEKDDRVFTIDEIIKDNGRFLYNFELNGSKFGHRAPEDSLEKV